MLFFAGPKTRERRPWATNVAGSSWVVIPSILRSLAARFEIARKSAFGAAVAPESSDLGSPIHFLCCAAGPGIAAALSGATLQSVSKPLQCIGARAHDRAASDDGRLRLHEFNSRDAVAAARPAKKAVDHDPFAGSNYYSLRRGSGAAAVADGPGRSSSDASFS